MISRTHKHIVATLLLLSMILRGNLAMRRGALRLACRCVRASPTLEGAVAPGARSAAELARTAVALPMSTTAAADAAINYNTSAATGSRKGGKTQDATGEGVTAGAGAKETGGSKRKKEVFAGGEWRDQEPRPGVLSGATYQSTFSHESLPDETLYILDGTAMLFTAYHSRLHQEQYQGAFLSLECSQEVTSVVREFDPSGEALERLKTIIGDDSLVPCGALTVMVLQFARFIKDVRPRYLCVAFDAGRATFRHEIFPSYKQQRPSVPAQILPLFELAPKVMGALGARTFTEPGFEADDVMATLGRWGRARGLNVVHVSADKDMLQLVEPGVHVMVPWSREMVGAAEVEERYGVPPRQLVDLQSLVGDRADNVPGIAGIGVKTASALIRGFRSIENLYESLGIVPGEPSGEPQARVADVAGALRALECGLVGVRMSPRSILSKLLCTSHADLLLYKQLIRLRDDVDIEGLGLATGDGLGVEEKRLSTQDFRYLGERRGADDYLLGLSRSLLSPLDQLRLTYHKLDRE